MTAGCVVLAAGAASRFGSAKQVILLPHVLGRLAPLVEKGTLAEVVVVEGAHSLAALDLGAARIVHADDWETGPGRSLAAGLDALGEKVDVAVVVLADGPRLEPATVERVLDAWAERPDAIVAASYGGARGHPLAIGRDAWAAIPVEGLRGVEPLLVPCDDLGDPGDVDRPEDLEPPYL